jgi:hypothetical protein
MKSDAKSFLFFIGIDVWGRNCDNIPNNRDAIVIHDNKLIIVGQPWRGNLRVCIATSITTGGLAQGIVRNVQGRISSGTSGRDIDALLGFSYEFVALST